MGTNETKAMASALQLHINYRLILLKITENYLFFMNFIVHEEGEINSLWSWNWKIRYKIGNFGNIGTNLGKVPQKQNISGKFLRQSFFWPDNEVYLKF